jgi:hypothetical protein
VLIASYGMNICNFRLGLRGFCDLPGMWIICGGLCQGLAGQSCILE